MVSRIPLKRQSPPVQEVTSHPSRIAISDAIAAFIAIREGTKIASATLRKYRTFTKQLSAFADSKGYVMLDQFTSADIDVFYATLPLGPRAKGKRFQGIWNGEDVKDFTNVCLKR
jgi:hypothetical protein